MALSEDARKELRDAIQIVRHDKFYAKYVKAQPNSDDDQDTEDTGKGKVTPPPEKGKETKPVKRSAWWGELMTDDE
jgi:hypothetical protein